MENYSGTFVVDSFGFSEVSKHELKLKKCSVKLEKVDPSKYQIFVNLKKMQKKVNIMIRILTYSITLTNTLILI